MRDGYLDLLGGEGGRGGRPAQRLMITRGLPVIYERWWRPAWGRVLMARAPLTPAAVGALVGAATGLRVVGRDEITEALEERGFEDVRRSISGLAQFVGAGRGRGWRGRVWRRRRTSTAAG